MADQPQTESREAQIEALKAKHGKLFELSVGEGEEKRTIIVRRPNRPEWKRFKTQARDDLKQDTAGITLLKTVLIEPEATTLDAWLNELPGLEESFAAEVIRLIGATERAEKKVL